MATSSITLGFIALATKSQLAIAVSMAFEIKPQLSDTKFKLSAYARNVALDSLDSISEKTATNYATIAKKLCQKFEAQIGRYNLAESDVLLFVRFLESEVASQGYTASLDDIGAYCDGKPSQKAKRLAAIAEAQAQAEREKAAEAKAQAEAEAAEAKRMAEEAEAQAEAIRKEAASVCVTVRVNAQGKPIVCFADNMNPAFLREAAQAMLDRAKAMEAEAQAAMGKASRKKQKQAA